MPYKCLVMGSRDVKDGFLLVGSQLLNRYEVRRVVGAGGFGVVYEGFDTYLSVPVAIKVMLADPRWSEDQRREFMTRFVAEARVMARLRHSHIARVQDVELSRMPSGDDAPWIVLEWFDGPTLHAELAARRARMSPAAAVALLRPVLDALAYAHEEGVAHRDLKPGNIILAQTRAGVSPQVLDFGIAKLMREGEVAGSGQTETTGGLGAFSPSYAAPEQVASTRTGPWTDVHALGLMLVELMVGTHPYGSKDRGVLLMRAVSEARPTPAGFGVDVGPMEAVLARAVAARPDERYPNARELLHALDRALADVTAPLPPRPRLPSASPRHRLRRGVAFSLGVVVVAWVTAYALRPRVNAAAGASGQSPPRARPAPVSPTSPSPPAVVTPSASTPALPISPPAGQPPPAQRPARIARPLHPRPGTSLASGAPTHDVATSAPPPGTPAASPVIDIDHALAN